MSIRVEDIKMVAFGPRDKNDPSSPFVLSSADGKTQYPGEYPTYEDAELAALDKWFEINGVIKP